MIVRHHEYRRQAENCRAFEEQSPTQESKTFWECAGKEWLRRALECEAEAGITAAPEKLLGFQ
jgi:hypothetical protein